VYRLPGGGLLIDNPGMREIQLWGTESGLQASFEDIEAIAAGCRFRDCRHESEPGCAVLRAVDDGRLAPGRLANYRALQRELSYLAIKQDEGSERAERKRWKPIQKAYRKSKRMRPF
jgi:ribosome biogenesis GTPase